MEMRMRPAFRLGGFSRSRSGSLAGHVLAAAGDLGLPAAQQQTIRDTQRSHRREEIRRDADVEIAELELEEMMEADTLDLDAIESHMRQIANLQVDERMANLRLDRSVREVLTAEQVDKLEELSPERVIFETYQRQRNR
jgi:Spy/CpxP family protein refolding chaperone